MYLALALLAEDPLSGGAGWMGAGLLGLVLAWLLLRHLPEKDRQQTELNDKHNARIDSLIAKHDVSLEKQREVFKVALDAIFTHCSAEMTELRQSFIEELNRRVPHETGDQ